MKVEIKFRDKELLEVFEKVEYVSNMPSFILIKLKDRSIELLREDVYCVRCYND